MKKCIVNYMYAPGKCEKTATVFPFRVSRWGICDIHGKWVDPNMCSEAETLVDFFGEDVSGIIFDYVLDQDWMKKKTVPDAFSILAFRHNGVCSDNLVYYREIILGQRSTTKNFLDFYEIFQTAFCFPEQERGFLIKHVCLDIMNKIRKCHNMMERSVLVSLIEEVSPLIEFFHKDLFQELRGRLERIRKVRQPSMIRQIKLKKFETLLQATTKEIP